jgi:hypothetical protein
LCIANAGKKKWIWIGSAIAAALLILCPIILCLAKKKQKYALQGIWILEKYTSTNELNPIPLRLYFLFLSFFFFYVDKKSKRKDLADSTEYYNLKDLEDDFKEHDIKVFNFTSILEATMDFSPENKLGHGGYGPVYKVTLKFNCNNYTLMIEFV